MAQPYTRPENRQRSSEGELAWADTVPNSFRSEAFPEDLPHPEGAAADGALLLRGAAALPLLGVALAAVFGILGR